MDEVEQMKRCLAVLYKEELKEKEGEEERDDDDDEDERESAFDMLSELCENMDNARGVYEVITPENKTENEMSVGSK